MSEELVKFSAGALRKGVNAFTGNISRDLYFDMDTYNVMSGINEGVGPRHGLAPIPGHSDAEAPAGSAQAGMMRAETSFGLPLNGSTNARTKCFGIYSMRFGGPAAAINTTGTYYASVIGYTNTSFASKTILSVSFLGTGTPVTHTTNIQDGICGASIDIVAGGYTPITVELIAAATSANKMATLEKLLDVTGLNYISVTPFSVNGQNVPMQWLYGDKFTAATNGVPPTLTFMIGNPATGYGRLCNGFPPEYNYGNFKKSPRTVKMYGLIQANGGGNANVGTDYDISYTPAATVYEPVYTDQGASAENYNAGGNGAVITQNGVVVYANINGALLNDADCVCNSSYRGFLIAAGKAIMAVVQDWWRGGDGALTQYVDLVNMPLEPRPIVTNNYKENGAAVQSCFDNFPVFVRGTVMGANTYVSLGGANTGTLRANTVYEFTYSVFNKRLGFETNVGPGVKFQTGVNDFDSLKIYDYSGFGGNQTVAANLSASGANLMPWPGSTNPAGTGHNMADVMPHINYLEYRFYYRQEGMQEWIPTLFIDAAKYWFHPYLKITAAASAVGALPGGRAGGFVDYSRLPDDKYTCSLVFRNRAFWISDKALQYSRQNNFFAYPANNSIACPSGSFKGAILHTFYGQAEQRGRIVVFGSNTVYVGTFTGNLLQTQVAVSTTASATLDIEGSDFVLDPWTSSTAFSYRSAVVAKGMLMWWGPDGIFQDNGVNTPDKVSYNLEPPLATLYDPSRTDEMNTVYDDRTKQIFWFYAPRTDDGFPTHALVYDTVTTEFFHCKFPFQVDAANQLTVETAIKTAGTRIAVYVRKTSAATLQRPYFFDYRNRAGDFYPTGEMMVKTIATPSAGIRRLTLAAGYDSTNFATVAIGDYITVQQGKDYSGLTNCTDMVAKVSAVNHGAGTVDILLPTKPTAALLDTASLAQASYLPIWHAAAAGPGVNAIQWQMKTLYWEPQGPMANFLWMYFFMRFGTTFLAYIDQLKLTLQYRTPVSSAFISDVLALTENADGNVQIYHGLRPVNRATEGQAIRFILSGNHIGHAWVLQWFEAHGNNQTFDFLKEFEG